MNQAIVELIVRRNTLLRVVRPRRVFQQDARLELRPLVLAYPREFQLLLAHVSPVVRISCASARRCRYTSSHSMVKSTCSSTCCASCASSASMMPLRRASMASCSANSSRRSWLRCASRSRWRFYRASFSSSVGDSVAARRTSLISRSTSRMRCSMPCFKSSAQASSFDTS